jgi:hypothetical protein
MIMDYIQRCSLICSFFKLKNWKCTCEKTKTGLNTLLGPTLTSLVFCLMIAYLKIFQKYPKDIPLVSLTKSLKCPFDTQICCILLW